MSRAAPDVTVVIPAYRAEKFIGRAIQSVLDQPGVDPEIIVVVDGVFDRTPEIAASFPKVSALVNQSNQGAPSARNRGLALAIAPFIEFLDADDFVEGPLLSGLLEVATGHELDLVFGRAFRQCNDGRRGRISAPVSTEPIEILREWLSGRFVPPCSVLWRAGFLRRIGGWKEGLAKNQDGELVWRALLKDARVGYNEQGAGIYVQHATETRITSGYNSEKLRSLLDVCDWLVSELEGSGRLDGQTRNSLIGYLYGGMCQSFLLGYEDVAREFEARWRQLGGRRHQGSWLHRLASNLIGLRHKQRLSNRVTTLRTRCATLTRLCMRQSGLRR